MAFSENIAYGVNLLQNSTLEDGLTGWVPFGPCKLSIHTESPCILASIPSNSLSHEQNQNGSYIIATDRSEPSSGLSQVITGKLIPKVTYQATCWVSLGAGACGSHNVSISVNVDDQWINGGQVVAGAERWSEIKGYFRIDKDPSGATVHVHGPPAGVEVKVMCLQMSAMDRKARFRYLKHKTEKVRKRDVVLKFGASNAASLAGTTIKIRQTQNDFPFGSCINRTTVATDAFVNFFVKNFDWAVFENELKWYTTEPQQGQLNYADADALLDFCNQNGKLVRGHCIFWAVDNVVQSWIKALGHDDLMTAVQNRLQGLLSRYIGKFPHYDVNNEMLHGAFYQNRLGDDINAYMFREANRIDPSAALFVNDYNVESENDPNATPEKYIELITGLQQRGALVGGIGLQGHVTNPVGEVLCDALDKLAVLGLPVWITELDVSETDVNVRADDLEVVLREAFAHPAVDGILFWGLLEGHMWRNDACLVNADGTVNATGQRYENLRREWMSRYNGHVDGHGECKFRGFHGKYVVEIVKASGMTRKSFVVDKGDTTLVLDMDDV